MTFNGKNQDRNILWYTFFRSNASFFQFINNKQLFLCFFDIEHVVLSQMKNNKNEYIFAKTDVTL